jgi:putative ABC transport system permease protein
LWTHCGATNEINYRDAAFFGNSKPHKTTLSHCNLSGCRHLRRRLHDHRWRICKRYIHSTREATIHSQTGHIQLAKRGFWAARSRASDTFMIPSTEKLKLTIGALQETDQVVSRVNFVGMLNNGKRDLGIFGDGIEPDGEARIGSFMRYIQGRPLADKDTNGMVIGQGVAQSLNLKVGDHATLVISLAQGAVNTLDFKVIGIFQSFSREFDARAVRIPLPAAQELLDTRSVHLVITTLKLTNDSERIASILKKTLNNEGLDIMTWRELSDFYEKRFSFMMLSLAYCV